MANSMRVNFEEFKDAGQTVDYVITLSVPFSVFVGSEPDRVAADYIDGLGLWVFVTFRSGQLGFVLVGQALSAPTHYLAVYADPNSDRGSLLQFLQEMGLPPGAPAVDADTGQMLS